jgi:hypothetical protein
VADILHPKDGEIVSSQIYLSYPDKTFKDAGVAQSTLAKRPENVFL